MISFCTWIWGDKYDESYIEKLHNGLRRNLTYRFNFRVFSPMGEDKELCKVPGCFARLRMFDPVWQKRNGLVEGEKLVCLDLDLVITGSLESLFNRTESFVILHGANAVNPCKFNGSVMMLTIGKHAEVWEDFSLEKAREVPFHEFPDDQGWLWHKLPEAAGWQNGPWSGIYAFGKRWWPKNHQLPQGAKIVSFFGKRDPSQFTHLDWVRQHWQ